MADISTNQALAIQAGAQLANTVAVAATNRAGRKWQESMYEKQRADNLADWQRQNEYNSPIAQMTRLKEAGLNPNLVYGNGTSTTAGPVSRAQMGSWNPQVPRFEMDFVDSLARYQNYQNQKLQSDNLTQDLQIKKAQEELIRSNTLKNLKTTDKLAFDLLKGNTLLQYQADAAKANLQNLNARTQLTIGQNQREWILNAPRLEETMARISLLKAQASKVPFEKNMLQQNAENLRLKNYWLPISEGQKRVMNNILQESQLLKNSLMNKQGRQYDAATDIMRLRESFMKAGVSPQVTENTIKSILSLIDFF